MSKLLFYREKLNLTQKELSDQSGISVRTIQRIEAGTPPKGHTLKALLKALDITEEDFLHHPKQQATADLKYIKWINFSCLLFVVPFVNILLPFVLMKSKNQENALAKQIISIQIMWTILVIVVVGISPFLVRWIGASRQLSSLLILIFALANLLIILRNVVEIQRNGKLYIRLKFSFI